MPELGRGTYPPYRKRSVPCVPCIRRRAAKELRRKQKPELDPPNRRYLEGHPSHSTQTAPPNAVANRSPTNTVFFLATAGYSFSPHRTYCDML